MAYQSIFGPDPFRRSQPADERTSSPSTNGSPSTGNDGGGDYLAELTSKLASHGGGESSGDLALDLLLNQIVEQVLEETTAMGAAIALIRDGELVCRATTGHGAPDLGVRLSTRSGLSGACFQTHQVQRSSDTENDPRVDAAGCRHLGIRSVLVLPVVNGGEFLGVFENYASLPNAFGGGETQKLQILCHRIAENVGHAAAAAVTPPEPDPSMPAPVEEITPVVAVNRQEEPNVETGTDRDDADREEDQPWPPQPSARVQPEVRLPPEVLARQIFLDHQPPDPAPQRDRSTAVLTGIVIVLALLLGWMVGRAGWQMAKPETSSAEPALQDQLPPSSAMAAPAPARRPEAPTAPKKARSTPSGISQASSVSKSGTNPTSAGDLVVYENGKVIFQLPPEKTPAAAAPSTNSDTAGGTAAPSATLALLSQEASKGYLIQRVEPQYPEEARQQHIQGSVVLETSVGRDGLVRDVKVISGDPQLEKAAADAVRQWRFRPYSPNGQPVEFETRVTVNFTLP